MCPFSECPEGAACRAARFSATVIFFGVSDDSTAAASLDESAAPFSAPTSEPVADAAASRAALERAPQPLRPVLVGSIASHTQTSPSIPPVANFRSRPSHSAQSTQPEWPTSVCSGVSESKSHSLQVWSPAPVASSRPVGLKVLQRIGDECPTEGANSNPRTISIKAERPDCRQARTTHGA